jgi:hypothetical protein
VLPLAWAGKVFIVASFLMIAGGAAALHRVQSGRWSLWPCLAFLFLYNRSFLWGFLNYLFGIGLAFLAFALWVALRERSAALRLGLAGLLATALFFAHLQALGVYGILIAGYETGRLHRAGRLWSPAALAALVATALPFLVPAALFFLGPHGAESGGIVYGRPVRKLDLLFSVFDNYDRAFDVAGFAVLVLALACLYWRRGVVLAPAFRLPLALLALAYLALPTGIFSGYGADHRLPLALALLLIGGSDAPAIAAPAARGLVAATALLFLARMAVVGLSWHQSDLAYAPLIASLDDLPPGARIAVGYAPDAVNSEATPLVHLPNLAIVTRDAFVPTLFAYETQQPVRLTPSYRALADRLTPPVLWSAFTAGAGPDEGERMALARYDWLVLLGRRPFTAPASPWLEPFHCFPRFALYRVRRSAGDGESGPRP